VLEGGFLGRCEVTPSGILPTNCLAPCSRGREQLDALLIAKGHEVAVSDIAIP
jgi:hypothetical protein